MGVERITFGFICPRLVVPLLPVTVTTTKHKTLKRHFKRSILRTRRHAAWNNTTLKGRRTLDKRCTGLLKTEPTHWSDISLVQTSFSLQGNIWITNVFFCSKLGKCDAHFVGCNTSFCYINNLAAIPLSTVVTALITIRESVTRVIYVLWSCGLVNVTRVQ